MRTYSVFGLKVRSELPLPELPETAGQTDVEIRIGHVSASINQKPGYNLTDLGTVLFIPEVARYLISGARKIVIAPIGQAAEKNLRLFLLGSAFGALLHHRGILPLHANAVDVDGRLVAFCGHSGAGKSTIAAWFHDRGFPVFADDVCAIGLGENGRPLAYPGIPRLRLWREALVASGRSVENHPRSFEDRDKYDVQTGADTPASAPRPLSAVYVLQKAPEHERSASVNQLRGVAAVEELAANTYRGGYVAMMDRTLAHLQLCLRIASEVPVLRASRVWGFDDFDEQASLLRDHVRQLER